MSKLVNWDSRFILVVKQVIWWVLIFITIPLTLVFLTIVRGGVLYGEDLVGGSLFILFKSIFVITPLLLSLWVLRDAKWRNVPKRWLWTLGILFLPVLIPFYLFHRRSYTPVKDSSSVNAVNTRERWIVLLSYLAIPLVLLIVGIFGFTYKYHGITPWEFWQKADESQQRWLKHPPLEEVTYLGNPYLLQQCYDAPPSNFRYYRQHVHGWNVYIPRNTPTFQNKRAPFPEIVLEIPGLWVCHYISQE